MGETHAPHRRGSALRPLPSLVVTGRDRRALVAGVAIITSAVMSLRIGPALLRGHVSRVERASLMAARLAETRVLVTTEADMLRDQSELAALLLTLAPELLEPGPGAGSALIGRVNETAVRSNVRIVRVEPLRDSVVSMFRRHSVRIEARSDTRGLARWLTSLETGQPRIQILRLLVGAENPAGADDQVETLRIEVVAAGWSAGESR